MDKNALIVVTGAAGFIGSCLTGFLNAKGFHNLIIVDEFGDAEKKRNIEGKRFAYQVERDSFFDWLHTNTLKIDFFFHLGARTDTTEFDYSVLEKLNVDYSKDVWQYCTDRSIPLVYASSAATYADGALGYKDDHSIVEKLHPLNPYGISKNEFDKWALLQATQKHLPPFWAGLKFFNVYGPNEYHKGRMASVVYHSFLQIQSAGKVRLFRSHHSDYNDGEQLRDFIYVNDVIEICCWMMEKISQGENLSSGLYNVGTGKARTFKDLATATFNSLHCPAIIEYIDTPPDIRERYQYYTQAEMTKLRAAGYAAEFYSLEEGIRTYVQEFLLKHKYY